MDDPIHIGAFFPLRILRFRGASPNILDNE